MLNIGIDLGMKESRVAVLAETGELKELRVRTERTALKAVFEPMPRSKILLESSTESEWVARVLEALGHEVVVADPNYRPMYGDRVRRSKTDRRDAIALAQACRLGAYRPAHRVSDEQRRVRRTLTTRDLLIKTRTAAINVIRAMMKAEGQRVMGGHAESFPKRVLEMTLDKEMLDAVKPLLKMIDESTVKLTRIDDQITTRAKKDPRLRLLSTCPQIGAVTSTALVAALDDARRFERAHEVEAYVGLVPREWSSGASTRKGSITKKGPPRLRALLVEAAHRILIFKTPETLGLRLWTEGILKRRGKKVAIVALARKLLGILWAMWYDQVPFDPRKGYRMAAA